MIRFLLRSLLPILAIVGLLLAPVAASAGAGTMAADEMTVRATSAASATPILMMMSIAKAMPGDMACCPQEKPSIPDCQKTCPLMALCSTAFLQLGSISGSALPLPIAGKELYGWPPDVRLDSRSLSPPIRPPRA